MKPNVERGRWVAAWLHNFCLGLLLVPSLSAQEPMPRATLRGHTGPVRSVAFSPDGKTLVSASYDGTLKLWDVLIGKERTTLQGHTGCVGSVAFSPNGKTVASAILGSPVADPDNKTIKLWDVATGKERAILQGHTGMVFAVAFSADGKTLASASDDKTVKLWDVATGKDRVTLPGHSQADRGPSEAVQPVMSVAFSPDGKTLACASDDKTVKLWDVATGKRVTFQGHTQAVYSVAFSPDGKTLASGSEDKTIKLWDVSTGKDRATLQEHAQAILSVAFSPDGKTLASASGDKTVKLWDVATGKERATLQGHIQAVTSVAFSPDGKILASASDDKTVKLWDMATRTLPAAPKKNDDGGNFRSGEEKGLSVIIKPTKAVFGEEELFAFDLTLKNTSKQPFALATFYDDFFYRFKRVGDGAEWGAFRVTERTIAGERVPVVRVQQLDPSQEMKLSFNISANYSFFTNGDRKAESIRHLPPGKYSVQITFSLHELRFSDKVNVPFWRGKATTVPVDFIIGEPVKSAPNPP